MHNEKFVKYEKVEQGMECFNRRDRRIKQRLKKKRMKVVKPVL